MKLKHTIDTERNMELLSELIAERFSIRFFNEKELQMEINFLLGKLVEAGLLEEVEGGGYCVPLQEE